MYLQSPRIICAFFFFNDTATTEIYTLSLHDALPICRDGPRCAAPHARGSGGAANAAHRRPRNPDSGERDRKSTRLNSSHLVISYAVFCLKKKTNGEWRQSREHLCATRRRTPHGRRAL